MSKLLTRSEATDILTKNYSARYVSRMHRKTFGAFRQTFP